MRLLILGDIVGRAGRDAVCEALPALRARCRADFVAVNAENASHGFGLAPEMAEALFAAGYPATAPIEEPALIEQALGEWQGLPHAELPARLARPAHPFWPHDGEERPPGGESMADVIARVGETLDRLAALHQGEEVVVVAHGGSIRAAVAHALGIGANSALHLSVQNLGLTRLDRTPEGWRVVCVNELPGY
jgi:broad specificity phosphatase PhoE